MCSRRSTCVGTRRRGPSEARASTLRPGATSPTPKARGPAGAGPHGQSLRCFRSKPASPLDGLDVYGLGALVALLRVIGNLRALLKRAVALAVDAGVMDEQVLVAVIRGDETKPLVVAEPLYGASWHVGILHDMCVLLRGGCCSELRPASACTAFAGPWLPAIQDDRSRSPPTFVAEMLHRAGCAVRVEHVPARNAARATTLDRWARSPTRGQGTSGPIRRRSSGASCRSTYLPRRPRSWMVSALAIAATRRTSAHS